MTVDELIERLQDLRRTQIRRGSFSQDHLVADDLLLRYIADARVTDAFNNINKSYSRGQMPYADNLIDLKP